MPLAAVTVEPLSAAAAAGVFSSPELSPEAIQHTGTETEGSTRAAATTTTTTTTTTKRHGSGCVISPFVGAGHQHATGPRHMETRFRLCRSRCCGSGSCLPSKGDHLTCERFLAASACCGRRSSAAECLLPDISPTGEEEDRTPAPLSTCTAQAGGGGGSELNIDVTSLIRCASSKVTCPASSSRRASQEKEWAQSHKDQTSAPTAQQQEWAQY